MIDTRSEHGTRSRRAGGSAYHRAKVCTCTTQHRCDGVARSADQTCKRIDTLRRSAKTSYRANHAGKRIAQRRTAFFLARRQQVGQTVDQARGTARIGCPRRSTGQQLHYGCGRTGHFADHPVRYRHRYFGAQFCGCLQACLRRCSAGLRLDLYRGTQIRPDERGHGNVQRCADTDAGLHIGCRQLLQHLLGLIIAVFGNQRLQVIQACIACVRRQGHHQGQHAGRSRPCQGRGRCMQLRCSTGLAVCARQLRANHEGVEGAVPYQTIDAVHEGGPPSQAPGMGGCVWHQYTASNRCYLPASGTPIA